MTMLNFADYKWETKFSWCSVLDSDELPLDEDSANSALCVVGDTQLAIFRSSKNKLFASQNLCGHRIAFVLSEGTLGVDNSTDSTYVVCPLHHRKFFLDGDLKGRTKSGMSRNHSIATFAVKEEHGRIWVNLPESEELDSVIGTHRWLPARPEASKPKAARFGFPLANSASNDTDSSNSSEPKCAIDGSTTTSPAICTAICGSNDSSLKNDRHPTQPEHNTNALPACHQRDTADNDSNSISNPPSKEHNKDPDSEEPTVCPAAKAQALCW